MQGSQHLNYLNSEIPTRQLDVMGLTLMGTGKLITVKISILLNWLSAMHKILIATMTMQMIPKDFATWQQSSAMRNK